MVWSSISNSEWDIPDFSDPKSWALSKDDLAIVLISALILTVLRRFTQNFFYQVGINRKCQVKIAYKFSESSWKVIWYTLSLTSGLILVYYCEWWPETRNSYRPFPTNPTGYYKLYYLLQFGFYVHSLMVHFFFEVKRSDFYVLFVHHIVTIWLIHFSYVSGLWKIGVLIMVVHDVSDVPLEAAKACSNIGYEFAAHFWFVLLIISWLGTRMSIFPFKIIYSVMFEIPMEVPIDVVPLYYVFNALLCVLQLMHIYWFFLIVRTAYRVTMYGNSDDVREDEKDD